MRQPTMLYHLDFTADERAPMPPVASLVAVEADSPMEAVERALAEGRYPQDAGLRWCRVVLSEVNGHAQHVMRVPIHVERTIPVDWKPGGG